MTKRSSSQTPMIKDPPIPEGMHVVATGLNTVQIRRTWRSWKVIPLAIFAVVWDSFLFFWYSVALAGKGTPLFAIIFPLGHVAVGLGITYFVVCSLLNQTDIEISPSVVRVKTHPLPWLGDRELAPTGIIDTRIKESYSKNGTFTYEVRYRTCDNRERTLVAGLSDDQAEFVNYHVRMSLGLRDESDSQANMRDASLS